MKLTKKFEVRPNFLPFYFFFKIYRFFVRFLLLFFVGYRFFVKIGVFYNINTKQGPANATSKKIVYSEGLIFD